MKKLISFFLLAALMLSLLPCAALAAGAPTLTVQAAEAQPGDTVTLAVELSGNPGINYIRFPIVYDADRLELLNITC